MNKKNFRDAILNEFKFYDAPYWVSRNYAKINMFYSGHGHRGYIKFSDFDFKYEFIVEHILECAND